MLCECIFHLQYVAIKDCVKLGFRMEMSGPKLCKALASTCRLRCSLLRLRLIQALQP